MKSKAGIFLSLFVWSLLAILDPGVLTGLSAQTSGSSTHQASRKQGPSRQSAGASRPLPGDSARPVPASTIDQILTNVAPGKDGWLTEQYDEEIKKELKTLKDSWMKRPLDKNVLAGLLTADFRGVVPQPRDPTSVEKNGNIEYSIYGTDTSTTIDRAQFLEETVKWLEGFREIFSLKLKTTGIVLEGKTPPRVRLPIRYNIVGVASDGSRLQATGYISTLWKKINGQWKWQEMTRQKSWDVLAKHVLFSDVSNCSLPKGEAQEQLQRGVDWWTANLDAAAHLQIHGHNGVAVADVDGDGNEDFYVCQGSGLPNRLFLSNGDGTFQETSARAGLDILDSTSSSLFFDFDNDGDPDLLLIGLDLYLFRNDGKGNFELLETATTGLATARGQNSEYFSACVADFNRDSWLDVYVTSYFRTVGRADEIVPVPYHDATNGARNYLFQNNGDGTFRNVTEKTGLNENNNRFSFACAWADYDKNGYPDVYVANDFGRNNLYRNNGDGTFTDVSAEAGVEDIAAGMSVSWEDYDNDGWLDLYVGNMYSTAGARITSQSLFRPASGSSTLGSYQRHARGNTLFRNLGNGTFADVSTEAEVTMGRWAWSSNFLDVDLDGNEDLYISNGYITNEQTHDL